jgi:hypothetical protein
MFSYPRQKKKDQKGIATSKRPLLMKDDVLNNVMYRIYKNIYHSPKSKQPCSACSLFEAVMKALEHVFQAEHKCMVKYLVKRLSLRNLSF